VYNENTRFENLSRTIICKRVRSEGVTPRFLKLATRWRWMAGFTAYLFCLGWKIARYPFDKWQCGPWTWYERCREEKNQSVPGLEPRFPVRPNRRLSQVSPPPWRNSPSGPGTPHYRCFTITLKHNTPGRTSLDVLSFRRNDVYLTTHNIHNRQVSMPPAGFEPAIPASERQQTHALDRAATVIGSPNIRVLNILQRIDNAIDKFSVF